ncbi:MAG: 2-hydroxyacid dehydrogenase [Hyphomicrobiales bacterium]|nr:2-hydroxyacid dehydrogenase [Hyphomicrobiales bacterium]
MAEFETLMMNPMPPKVVEGIAAVSRLHKLWEAPDRDKALAEIAPRIQGIATGGGHAKLDGAMMSRFPNLKIVSSFGVGYDHIDAAWAGQHGVIVTNTPDVLNDEVADTTMGLILCAVRQLPQADRFVREGKWLKGAFPLTASLRGRTLGILGLGRIGVTIARRAEAFGMKVIYHSRRPRHEEPYPYFPTLVGMARACDILVAITPGGPETKHLINAEVLEALGPNGVFINVARGSVCDEQALIAALRDRKILTAGLDVFADEPNAPKELLEMDHVVLLPHVGSGTNHTRDAMGQLVVDNIAAFIRNGAPLTPVAETPWPAAGAS